MIFVIDAYNVIFSHQYFSKYPVLQQKREELLNLLIGYAGKKGGIKKIHAVFDGSDLVGPWTRRADNVKVIVSYSSGSRNADQTIIQLIMNIQQEGKIHLVTDDISLRNEAKAFGTQIISTSEMMSRMLTHHSKERAKSIKIDSDLEEAVNDELKKKWKIS